MSWSVTQEGNMNILRDTTTSRYVAKPRGTLSASSDGDYVIIHNINLAGEEIIRALYTDFSAPVGASADALRTTLNTVTLIPAATSLAAGTEVTLASGATVSVTGSTAPANGVFRFLSDDGTTTGTKNARGNYSAAQTPFFAGPGAGVQWVIRRMVVFIGDSVTNDADKYGNINTLGNGITVEVHNGITQLLDLTDGVPIKNNIGWSRNCFDTVRDNFSSGNEHFVSVRWTFGKSGRDILLDGDKAEVIRVLMNDNLTGLVEHYFKIDGYVVT